MNEDLFTQPGVIAEVNEEGGYGFIKHGRTFVLFSISDVEQGNPEIGSDVEYVPNEGGESAKKVILLKELFGDPQCKESDSVPFASDKRYQTTAFLTRRPQHESVSNIYSEPQRFAHSEIYRKNAEFDHKDISGFKDPFDMNQETYNVRERITNLSSVPSNVKRTRTYQEIRQQEEEEDLSDLKDPFDMIQKTYPVRKRITNLSSVPSNVERTPTYLEVQPQRQQQQQRQQQYETQEDSSDYHTKKPQQQEQRLVRPQHQQPQQKQQQHQYQQQQHETKKDAQEHHLKEQQKQDQSTTKLLSNHGRVVNVLTEKKFGFIKQHSDGPECPGQDIFFHFDRVQSNFLPLKRGDQVEFNLSKQKNTTASKHKSISAAKVMVLKIEKRSLDEINEYLNIVEDKIEIKDAAEKVDQGSISLLLMSTNVWKNVTDIICGFINDNDVLLRFLNILVYLEQSIKTLDERYRQVLKAVGTAKLLNPLRGRMKTLICDTRRDADIKSIQNFLLLLAKLVPEKLQAVVALIKPMTNSTPDEHTVLFMYKLLKISTKSYAENVSDMTWDDLPLILTNQEMFSTDLDDRFDLKPVQTTGAYAGPDEYMDTYFRLLRADCFDALKIGIQKLIKGDLDMRDMNVYINVTLIGMKVSNQCVYMALKVTSCRQVKNWDTCSNLMYGNLLCISIGGSFRQPIWVTVVDRGLLKDNNVVLVQPCWEINEEGDADVLLNLMSASSPIVMVESPTYYRAYQPVLKSLQSMPSGEISFQQELVYLDKDLNTDLFDLTATFDSTIVYNKDVGKIQIGSFLKTPYHSEHSIFDESQEKAVKTALKSRIGIIQGPPGCGKSFIGVKMLNLLLSLSSLSSPKVLVLTYKNHALDEFLKQAVTHYPEEVVRIGGRSRDPDLDKISLQNVRRAVRKGPELFNLIKELNKEIDVLKEDIEKWFDKFNELKSVPFEAVLEYLTPVQRNNLIVRNDWSRSDVKSFGITKVDENGFQQVKSKRKNRITKEEVELIINNASEENPQYLDLLKAAFKAWLPNDNFSAAMESQLSDRGSVAVNVQKLKDLSKGKEKGKGSDVKHGMDQVLDVDEIQKERLSAVSKTENVLKGDYKKEMKLVNYEDKKSENEHVKSFSNAALKNLSQNNYGLFLNIEDLWDLNENDRVNLVQYFISQEKNNVATQFEQAIQTFENKCKEKNEIENQHTSLVLRNKKVIGMTITGAAIHQQLLKEIQPEIVIVEEAAEVLEPQLVASIGTWTKYMLLIGDHQQLRPPVESYHLRKNYNFDISMMERLIKNGMPFEVLEMQNRQRPEFAELLKDIYPDLKTNLKRVSKNEPANCLLKSHFFWHHTSDEIADRSYTNIEDANRAVKLALFLTQQGCDPERITILAAYQGQTFLIRKTLKEMEAKYKEVLPASMKSVIKKTKEKDGEETAKSCIKVHTVDMYQGDENDFVIVSLVRSNSENKIGFLKQLNRRCVLQSRAKCGVYFIGNADMFLNHAEWQPMMQKLKASQGIGDKLEVVCPQPQHKQWKYFVNNADDIGLKSFCKQDCVHEMSCGIHHCEKQCQPPHSHKPCGKKIAFEHLMCGHKDTRLCEEDQYAKLCKNEMPFTFPKCGHPGKKKCCDDISAIICDYEESVKLPCGHTKKKKCSKDVNAVTCNEKCNRMMPCKHSCNHKCYEHDTIKFCKICQKIKEAEAEAQRKAEELIRSRNMENVEKEMLKIRSLKQIKFEIKEIVPQGETASEYLDIEDYVKKYVQADHRWYPTVTKIEKVINLNLKLKWLDAKSKMFDIEMKSKLKFHGTSVEGVKGITENGFLLPTPKSGQRPPMYGYGVYFASDSSKSAQEMYTKGSNMLLLCDVLLGKQFTVKEACPEMSYAFLKRKKCDSLFAQRDTAGGGGVKFDEFVVFNPNQAFPKYIIHYQKTGFHAANPFKDYQFRGTFQLAKKDIAIQRGVNLGSALEVHLRIAESQFYRLLNNMGMRGAGYKISKVEYYMNDQLKKNFDVKHEELKRKYGNQNQEAEIIFGFHGTKQRGIVEDIMNNNFIPSLGGKFGAGVYFSEMPGYTFGYGGEKFLILAQILPGKIRPCPFLGMQTSGGLSPGYDSHGGLPLNDGSGRYNEIVIFDKRQILPTYVIHLI